MRTLWLRRSPPHVELRTERALLAAKKPIFLDVVVA